MGVRVCVTIDVAAAAIVAVAAIALAGHVAVVLYPAPVDRYINTTHPVDYTNYV